MTQVNAGRYCAFTWIAPTRSIVGTIFDTPGVTLYKYQGVNFYDYLVNRNPDLNSIDTLEQWRSYMISVTVDITLPDTITGVGDPPPTGQPLRRNLVGIGLPPSQDYEPSNLMANVFKLCRPWFKFGQQNTPAQVNARSYPLEDATAVVWAGDDKDGGMYKLRFVGDCDFSFSLANVSVTNRVFANGVTTADVFITGRSQNLFFNVQNIRSPLSDASLMRPTSDGANTAYPLGQLFTNKALSVLPKFDTVRFMDWTGTNGNNQHVWGDRALYADFSWQTKTSTDGYGYQGLGCAWESVIQACNDVGCNAWINIPSEADDNYVFQLATLFRDGNSTVAPLRSDLMIYVEYTNEMWNFGFDQYGRIRAKATIDGAVSGSPLNYDNNNDVNQWTVRQQAKRTIEISNIFRTVFGNVAMGGNDNTKSNKIRIVLQAQQYNPYIQRLHFFFLEDYYNNKYSNFVSQPHPPSYYIYGAGGSGYYSPDNEDPNLSVAQIFTSNAMNYNNWFESKRADMDVCVAYGINGVCYEGGSGFDHLGINVANKDAACYDDRMEQNMVDHYEQVWAPTGFKLLTYFTFSGANQTDGQWSFIRNANTNTPKIRAIDRLRASNKSPVTYGLSLPFTINGGQWSLSTGFGSNTPNSDRRCQPGEWYSYNYHSSVQQTRNVEIEYSCNSATTIEVYQGGDLLRSANVASSGGSTVTLSGSMTLNLIEDEIYALRVRCPRTATEFQIKRIKVL